MPNKMAGWFVSWEKVIFSPKSLSLSQNSPSAPKHFQESKIMYLRPPAPESAIGFLTPLEGGFPAFTFWRLEDLLGIVENGKKSSADPERGGGVYGKLFLTSGFPPAAFFLYSA